MSSNKNARYNRFSSGTTTIATSENTNGVRAEGPAGAGAGAAAYALSLSVDKIEDTC